MKTLVISDLHSNYQALRAVLSHVRRKKFDRVACLGDFVGYGPHPNQVLDLLRQVRAQKFFVRGNHDRVAAGFDDGEGFNHVARAAALWTRDQLSKLNRQFLKSLPLGPRSDGKDVLICHGSPLDEDEYVFTEYDAYRIFRSFQQKLIFFGHTHLPVIFTLESPREITVTLVQGPVKIRLDPAKRYLVNPGSVGQPRDRNPLSSALIFDERDFTAQFFRVPYDIARTGNAILRAGLPRVLADRLRVGA